MKTERIKLASAIIIIFHIVGFLGFVVPQLTDYFRQLVPFHLLLMFGLLVYSHVHKNAEFWKFIITAYLAGFIVELLGVNTGDIFGHYSYGRTLGIKFAETPLMIGVNWVIMVYSTGVFLCEFKIRSRLLRSIVGALLLTFVDFLIEPIAIRQDYWAWNNFDIPIQNYVAWFVFSFLMLSLFYNLRFKKHNPAGSVLFVVQLLFFLALNFTI